MNVSVNLRYDGDGNFSPASPYWAKQCDETYIVGEVYRMAEWRDRSDATHAHQFAYITEAWRNLPEKYGMEPWAQSPEHLRKYALIRCRFCKADTYVCGSKAEAERWARNLRPLDEYSIVTVEGTTVYRFTAESQSRRNMGAKRFQESKTAVIQFLEDLLGIARGTLEKQTEAA